MKNMKKVLSLVAACSIIATFSAITPVYADNEITITPVVEVKIGTASYTTYTDQELSAGDKVRIKYEYAGPETNEIWTEGYYDEDNEVDVPAELIGGTAIRAMDWSVSKLDSDYFTAGNPTYYNASTANQWLFPSTTYATINNNDDAILISFAKIYTKEGIFKNTGRITQIIYTLNKDLDKDVVIGPRDGFNYTVTISSTDAEGNETEETSYQSKYSNSVKFNTVTLKGTSGEDEAVKTDAIPGEVFNNPGSAKASTFTVTSAPTGTKAYWYAKIGGEPKRAAAVLPATLGGEVMLGLVFHGTETIENVQLGWE